MGEFMMTVAPIIDFGNGFYIDLSSGPWPTQGLRIAIAAGSGSGKSHLTAVILEELAGLGIPFLVIDPEGEYRGLKQLDGAKILTVKEKNGDICLSYPNPEWVDETIRALIGGAGVIADLSTLGDDDQRVAYLWLLEHLWNVQRARREREQLEAVFIIVEEATIFAPQKWQSDAPSLLMTVKIAKRGRKIGINSIFVTQRPGDLEKDVLSQSNLQIVGYLRLERDFKAVESLLQVGGTSIKHRDLLGLKTGEFFAAFGPKVVRFPPCRKRRTPDYAATPPLQYRQRTFIELSQPAERD